VRRMSFSLLSLLAIPALAAIGLSAWITCAPAVPFDGEQDVALDVEVQDATSQRAIGNAVIRISDPFFYRNRQKTSEATTRNDGRARIVHRYTLVGERRAYRLKGKVHFEERWLEISAPGYQRTVAPLAKFTGEQGDLQRPTPIRVMLQPGESAADGLRDTSGHFERRWGQGFATLDILPDGRFAWTASGCWSYEKEYGFAKVVDGALRLEPIPRGGHEVNPYILDPLYPIKWDKCTFLLAERQILEFCNTINQGPDPRTQITDDFYHQDQWRENELEGLPVLPAEWNTYLLKNPVSATITQVGPDGSATINRGSQDGIKKGMHLKAHGVKGDEYPYREVEIIAVEDRSSVVRKLRNDDCASRQSLSYFGDTALTKGEKVTSRFREDDATLAGPRWSPFCPFPLRSSDCLK
jgi:hypothetical protein